MSRGKRGHLNLKEAFRPGGWNNRPWSGLGGGDKAQTYCPRLEGLVPWLLRSRSRLDTYERFND